MVEINPSVGAAYGGGQQIDPRIQALEGLRALEQAERATASEAAIQERVARRSESVIVTISAEARAMIAADTQRVAEPANQPQASSAPLSPIFLQAAKISSGISNGLLFHLSFFLTKTISSSPKGEP